VGPGGLGAWSTEAELDILKASVEKKASNADYIQSAPPALVPVEFDAYIIRSVVRGGGDLEIVIGVPPNDKWEALRLTDTAGLMLRFHVEGA
jgi:hypothetical protein